MGQIKLKKIFTSESAGGQVWTATWCEVVTYGATREEAVGKMILQNPEFFDLGAEYI